MRYRWQPESWLLGHDHANGLEQLLPEMELWGPPCNNKKTSGQFLFHKQRKIVDANGDGRISEKELVAVGVDTKFFEGYDQNGDGLVLESEFVMSFESQFNAADRNDDGRISIDDAGLVDKDGNGKIDTEEYREVVDDFFKEVMSESTPRGYGYGPCSSQYMICDASCTRCIAFFIPRPAGFSWGGAWPHGPHPCDDFNSLCCDDPWSGCFDPMNPCCN